MENVEVSRVWKLAAQSGPVEICELTAGSVRLVIHQAHVGLMRAWNKYIDGIDDDCAEQFAYAVADIIEECRGLNVVTVWKGK